MAIQFTCPHCGARTNVSDEYAGMSGPCVECGETITVPPAEVVGPALPAKRSRMPRFVIFAVLGFLLATVVCAGILMAVLPEVMEPARDSARRLQCSNNLQLIGLAMHNYHAVYGSFPPAYVADAEGRPMHSWRALLLPYLEESTLAERYDFDQPWDSPDNLDLAQSIPDVYRCPSDDTSTAGETSYVMIVGPHTVSDGTGVSQLADVTDGTSNTILVVETTGSGINWLDPRDLDAKQISFIINDPIDEGARSEHPLGAHVLFCDGSTMFLSDSLDETQLEAMSTIDREDEL